ncbi:hypothetical protein CLOM_g5199 [Closterium sp. NIES-68]|nr:hypothetical protein CLOM_g5199 [Closterium sp. NIES-68]
MSRLGPSVCALHRAFAMHCHAEEATAERLPVQHQRADEPGGPWRLSGASAVHPARGDGSVSRPQSGRMPLDARVGERGRQQRWLLEGGDDRVQAWFWHRVFGASIRAVELQWWPNGGEIFRQSLIAARRSKQAEGGAEVFTAPLLPMAAPPVAGVCPYDETAVSALESLERTGHSATEVDTWQIIVGGLMRSGQAVMDVVLVDTATMAMRHPHVDVFSADSPPLPRFRHTAVLVRVVEAFRHGFAGPSDPVLFVFGGYNLQGGVYGAEESFFLAITDAGRRVVWRRATAAGVPPSPRFHHTMCSFDHGAHVIVYGGEGAQLNDWADEADEQLRGWDATEGEAGEAEHVRDEASRGLRATGRDAQAHSPTSTGSLGHELFERRRRHQALSAQQGPPSAVGWCGGGSSGSSINGFATALLRTPGAVDGPSFGAHAERFARSGGSEGRRQLEDEDGSGGVTWDGSQSSLGAHSSSCSTALSSDSGSSSSCACSSGSASLGGAASACSCCSADECDQRARASAGCEVRAIPADSAARTETSGQAAGSGDSAGVRAGEVEGAVAHREGDGGTGAWGEDEVEGDAGRGERNEQAASGGVGGAGGEQGERAAVVYVLDVRRMVWRRVATRGRGPGVRFLHHACTHSRERERGREQERLVVFGGYREKHEEMEDMQAFTLDLSTMTWHAPPRLPPSRAALLPLPRNRSGITKVGPDQIVLVEGTTYGTRDYLSDVYLLNLRSLHWSPVRVHGAAMAGPSAGHSVEGLLVLGGCVLGTLGIHPISRVDPLLLGNFGTLALPPATACLPSVVLAPVASLLVAADPAPAVVADSAAAAACDGGSANGPLDLILRVRDVRNTLVRRSDWADAGNDDYAHMPPS